MDILSLEFYSNDLGQDLTIREFFEHLLLTLWFEKEEFDGKRPFGNSDWDGDLLVCLIKNKVLKGKIDSDGYIQTIDHSDEYVSDFIAENIIEKIFKDNSKEGKK